MCAWRLNARAKRLLAVVEVEGLYAAEADFAIELGHRGRVLLGGFERITGREGVARVDAHSQSLGLGNAADDRPQVLEPPAERAALPCRVFQCHAGGDARGLAMDPIERLDDAANPLLFGAVGVGAGMRDDERHSQRFGAEQLDAQRLGRTLPQRVVRAGEVDEIGVVRQRMFDLQFGERGAESLGVLVGQLLRATGCCSW